MKWITVPLFEKLVQRFGLSVDKRNPTDTLLSEIVVPVTSYDELLNIAKVYTVTVDLHAAGATLFTVPANKRWRIIELNKVAATVGSVNVGFTDGVITQVACFASGLPGFTTFFTFPLSMMSGWSFIASQGNVADVAVSFNVWIIEEPAY